MESIPSTTRRMPIRRGRRIPVSVTLAPETQLLISTLGEGNRSAGIEELARMYWAREILPQQETA
jgi:hypothetical protein